MVVRELARVRGVENTQMFVLHTLSWVAWKHWIVLLALHNVLDIAEW